MIIPKDSVRKSSKVVYQIRTSWNTLIPYMEEIAVSVQEKIEIVETVKKQEVAALGTVAT